MDITALDKVIHERGRLAIVSLLATRIAWSFQELKVESQLSDGNLITHLRYLEKANYLRVVREKEKETRKITRYELTAEGRTAFEKYLTDLEVILRMHRPDGGS